jgi:hypothetical protein
MSRNLAKQYENEQIAAKNEEKAAKREEIEKFEFESEYGHHDDEWYEEWMKRFDDLDEDLISTETEEMIEFFGQDCECE